METAHRQVPSKRYNEDSTPYKKLAGTDWGANGKILSRAYTGYVRPALEYEMSAWGTAAKSNTQKISKIQNPNLRIITGGMNTTPITEMETCTGLPSIEERRNEKILTQYAKFKCLESHQMNKRLSRPTKERLKRGSFLHSAKKLQKSLTDTDLQNLKPLNTFNTYPTWDRNNFPKIMDNIPSIILKTETTIQVLKETTKNHIQKAYPKDIWTHVYTDGSAKEAVLDGGAGIYIVTPDGKEIEKFIPTGKHSTNFKAEMEAIIEAAKMLINFLPSHNRHVVVLTDAKSVLQAVKDPKNTSMNELMACLLHLSSTTKEKVLQWIPGHCGILGNEKADLLARKGDHKNK